MTKRTTRPPALSPAEIKRDLAAFLAAGGTVKQYAPTVRAPRLARTSNNFLFRRRP